MKCYCKGQTSLLSSRFGSKHSLAHPSQHSLDSFGLGDDAKQMYIQTVYYKSNIVAMKELKYVPLTRSLMLELKCLKDLHHDHIVAFHGACIDQGTIT